MTHIYVSKLTIIGSDNGLSPEQRQAIIWTNAGILLIGPLGTNFSEILIEFQTFSLKKIRLKMSSAKCCSFHLGLNVLIVQSWWYGYHGHRIHINTAPADGSVPTNHGVSYKKVILSWKLQVSYMKKLMINQQNYIRIMWKICGITNFYTDSQNTIA